MLPLLPAWKRVLRRAVRVDFTVVTVQFAETVYIDVPLQIQQIQIKQVFCFCFQGHQNFNVRIALIYWSVFLLLVRLSLIDCII